MYNSKDIEALGKHDFDKARTERFASAEWAQSFSVNIFKWILKGNGKSLRKSKGLVRVKSECRELEKVFEYCEQVVKDLDNNEWDGRKTVVLK